MPKADALFMCLYFYSLMTHGAIQSCSRVSGVCSGPAGFMCSKFAETSPYVVDHHDLVHLNNYLRHRLFHIKKA